MPSFRKRRASPGGSSGLSGSAPPPPRKPAWPLRRHEKLGAADEAAEHRCLSGGDGGLDPPVQSQADVQPGDPAQSSWPWGAAPVGRLLARSPGMPDGGRGGGGGGLLPGLLPLPAASASPRLPLPPRTPDPIRLCRRIRGSRSPPPARLPPSLPPAHHVSVIRP